MARAVAPSLFTPSLLGPAVLDAVRKLAPAQLIRNPVMFVTAVVAALLTLFLFTGGTGLSLGFQIQIVVWLWLTVLFGNFCRGAGRRVAGKRAGSVAARRPSPISTRPAATGGEIVRRRAIAQVGDEVMVDDRRTDPRRWRGYRRASLRSTKPRSPAKARR